MGIAIVVVVAALSFSIFSGDDDSNGGGEDTLEDARSDRTVVVDDDFERRSTRGLGRASADQEWETVSGRWGLSDGEAVIREPNDDGPRTIAVVLLPSSNGTVEAVAGSMTEGWGLVFRYVGPFNYWYLTAAPDNSSYSVHRVLDGVNQPMGPTNLAPTEDGSRVRIEFEAATLRFFVDDEAVRMITDPTLQRGRMVGLIAFGDEAAAATWQTFKAEIIGEPQPVPIPSSTVSETSPTSTESLSLPTSTTDGGG